jgi:hypothetical protein
LTLTEMPLVANPEMQEPAPKIANAVVSPTNPNLKIIKTSGQVSGAVKNLGKGNQQKNYSKTMPSYKFKLK